MKSQLKPARLFAPALVTAAFREAFLKLDPRILVKNPVMFTVEIGTAIMFAVTTYSAVVADAGQGDFGYNALIAVILLLTVWFGNFAEALAEARGKAQAASLRNAREDTPARKRLSSGQVTIVNASELSKGDVFEVQAGDVIPADGEII
jgi:K+-transporting ATPase ATPase B chain